MTVQDLCRKILAASFTIPEHVSPLARDLLVRMLTVDPLQRITLLEVCAAKQLCLVALGSASASFCVRDKAAL